MPRKRRSITVRKRSKSAPAAISLSPCVSKKWKEWNNESMVAAIKAAEEGQSLSRAARDHGVSKTTLHNRVSGRVLHGVNSCPKPYLNSVEEKELGTYLKHCAKIGYGKTQRDVFGLVQTIATEKGVLRSSRVSEGWWRQFLERQSDLLLRQGIVRPIFGWMQ